MSDLIVTEMNKPQILFDRLKRAVIRLRRKLPYLVWYNQEIDCRVTWKENRLTASDDMDMVIKQLDSGHLHEIEKMIAEIGIGFDRGMGGYGRDWEWDWSLKGPISVAFRGACKTKGKRR